MHINMTRIASALVALLIAWPVQAAQLTDQVQTDLETLAPDTAYGAILHFDSGTPASHRQLVQSAGMAIGHDFEEFADALYVMGTIGQLATLTDAPEISFIEHLQKLEYAGDTASWATRARVAQEAVAGGPFFDDQGRIIDGTGVGIAVVDSGTNTPHPDLAARTAANLKVVCPVPLVSEENIQTCQYPDFGTTASTDTTGGHGTHVAGIALGDGTFSDGGYPDPAVAPNNPGTFTGVAPGASLYAFGAGETLFVLNLNAAASFDWILKNNDALEVPIRAVNNSYGGDGPHNPNSLLDKLASRLAESGVAVVFAAGNSGGTGSDNGDDPSTTSSSCRNPTPGVICVANYDDAGTGRRDAALAGSSSRAAQSRLTEYPDIAAPGTNYTSTCSQAEPGQAVCATGLETDWQPYYGTITGTSMASPHVAGALALLFQADPTLTSAEAELLMQNTALKVTSNGDYVDDPQNPGGTHNFGFGAGLLDVTAALRTIGVTESAPVAGPITAALIAGDEDSDVSGHADVVAVDVAETTLDGDPALRFDITVRDATVTGSQATLALRYIIDGGLHTSGVSLIDGTASVATDANVSSAPPAAVGIDGNVVSMTVTLGSLGGSTARDLVHGIQAMGYESGSLVDLAPSTALPLEIAELQPMYGKPFSLTMNAASSGGQDFGDACVAPGVLVSQDIGGDATTGAPQHDIREVYVGEFFVEDQADRLFLEMKLESLQPELPNSTYYVFFTPTDDDFQRFVSWDSDPILNAADPASTFEYGFLDPNGPTGSTLTTEGQVDAGSVTPDGTIRWELAKSKIATLADAAQLRDVSGDARALIGAGAVGGLVVSVDSSPAGTYDVVGNASCAEGAANTPPVAALDAPASADVDESITVSAAGSSDADDDMLTYTFDFGDGTVIADSAQATASHAYDTADTYTITVTVNDGEATDSASQTITVSAADSGPGSAIAASLVVTRGDDSSADDGAVEGDASDSFTFDASDSGYVDANGGAFEYSFVFGDESDASEFMAPTNQAVVTHTYDAAGEYTAYVIVTDNNGNSDRSDDVTVTTTITITVEGGNGTVAQLTVDRTSGPAPLTINFDGSQSFAAEGETITEYCFDFGTGDEQCGPEDTARYTYTTPGSYSPSLTVTSSDASTAKATANVSIGNATPAPGAAAPSGGGSSGGMGWLTLSALAGLAIARRRRR